MFVNKIKTRLKEENIATNARNEQVEVEPSTSDPHKRYQKQQLG